MKLKLIRILPLCCLLMLTVSLPAITTGCGSLKPVAVEEGHDPVVVRAEAAQRSSLKIFREVTVWEFNNRMAVPAEVSRGIDVFRREFPPAWEESRLALEVYKQRAGSDPTTMNSITAALLTFQDSFLKLKKDANPNQVTQVSNALGSLINSIRSFFGRATPPLVPQPPR